MIQTKESKALRAFGQARQELKKAKRSRSELTQHKGGYTTAYRNSLNAEIKENVKLAQQLIHFAIENSTGMANVTSNPSVAKLEELGVLDKINTEV